MNDKVFAGVITVAFIAFLAGWVPLLDLVWGKLRQPSSVAEFASRRSIEDELPGQLPAE